MPATIYTAPIVLVLSATPAERRGALSYLFLLAPVWLALCVNIALQLVFSIYMNQAIVDLVTDDLEPDCGATSPLLMTVALATFVSLVVADILETYQMHAWLCALPGADAPEALKLLRFTERDEPPDGKNMLTLPVSGIASGERTAFYIAWCVGRESNRVPQGEATLTFGCPYAACSRSSSSLPRALWLGRVLCFVRATTSTWCSTLWRPP